MSAPAWVARADTLCDLGRFEEALMTLDRARPRSALGRPAG
jgi:hypothetical protein